MGSFSLLFPHLHYRFKACLLSHLPLILADIMSILFTMYSQGLSKCPSQNIIWSNIFLNKWVSRWMDGWINKRMIIRKFLDYSNLNFWSRLQKVILKNFILNKSFTSFMYKNRKYYIYLKIICWANNMRMRVCQMSWLIIVTNIYWIIIVFQTLCSTLVDYIL